MAPDLLRIAESPNLNGISVTNRRAGGDAGKQGSDTEQITGVTSLSWKCLFPCDLPPELLVAIFLAYTNCSQLDCCFLRLLVLAQCGSALCQPLGNTSFLCIIRMDGRAAQEVKERPFDRSCRSLLSFHTSYQTDPFPGESIGEYGMHPGSLD